MILSKGHHCILSALSLLILYCVITSLISSICVANSLCRTLSMVIVLVVLQVYDSLNRKFHFSIYIETSISILAIVLFICSTLFYLRFVFTPLYVGLSDISQFRYLYTPLGILSNDWVSIQLMLMPVSLVALLKRMEYNPPTNRLHLIALCLEFVSIVMTMSRIGWITVALIIFFLGVLAYRKILKIDKYIIICSTVVCFLVLLFVVSPEGILSTLYQSESHIESANGRVRQFNLIDHMTTKQFLFGVGLDNYTLFSYANNDFSINDSFTGRANSLLLNVIIESGMFGLLLYFILLVSIIVSLHMTWNTKSKNNESTIMVLTFFLFLIILKECCFTSITHNSCYLFLFLFPFIDDLPKEYISNKTKKSILFRNIAIEIFVVVLYAGYVFYRNTSFWNSIETGYLTASSIKVSFPELSIQQHPDDTGKSVSSYMTAISQNPYDASFYHNLSWIYYSCGKDDLALDYIRKTINLNKSNPLYYVVCGMFAERLNLDYSMRHYTKAIMLNPSICFSAFWNDFSKKHPGKAKKAIDDAIFQLKKELGNSTKITAKIGILYYKRGENDIAKETLLSVVDRMPSLNRVWLYLYFLEHDIKKKKNYLNRAILLNPSDNLPYYIKYHETNAKVGMTDYSDKKNRLYYCAKNRHDYLPRNLYSYVISPTMLYK